MTITIDNSNKAIKINLNTPENSLQLPALWIRERAQDNTQIDLKTKQRLINPHLLPADLSITHAKLQDNNLVLAFSDGYQGHYQTQPLINDALGFQTDLPTPKSWLAGDKIETTFNWQQLKNDEVNFFQAISSFLTYGYLILDNTPTEKESILEVANKFGHVRDTNFGRYFEVYSRPNANDLAYTPHAIGPHTDNPYRDPVPGIQLLHCLVNETQGGFSTLVDSISIAEALYAEDSEGYELLANTPVRFRFYDQDVEHIAYHSIIEKDNLGNILGIHYSPRLDDLPLLPEQTLQHYQTARKRLSKLLEDEKYEIKFKLDPGQLMIFDNNRVLHGRTSFNPNEGFRHLQGCYIDRDTPKSHYRILAKKYISTQQGEK